MRLKNPSDFEENFEEAARAVNTCLGGALIPDSLQQLFGLLPSPLTPDTPPFWLVLAGELATANQEFTAKISYK